ncbi:metal-dependent hydrolase [Helicobacter sp. MIT 00-7814]|uniref:aminofutalosine deaminase family hydrolase n=1 Tax=unclassified Helicobacter TaxID=2593540 RepID=UPI000E1F9BB9|nr:MULTISPECIES: aminofutalosine deaminase family hydrolase [unclassified Helicobacter]RDU55030.1 metal-dependent hydrolase [Helicobacter sp. MIT 00-7814]RDU55939.1 metal-dependent hydrolase [Helicobacter sp. MIT 99-10781]
MSKLLGAPLAFVCDEDFSIRRDFGVFVENGKIVENGDFSALCEKYKNVEREFFEDCVMLPAFINAHIHFEFSSNATSFAYGDFGAWLDSVIAKRDGVLGEESAMQSAINEQLQSGVGIVGAISSYGYDLPILAQSPLRVVFFNEAMGSNPSAIDALYKNFKVRLQESKRAQNALFTPAVALHSPYSLHSVFAKHVLNEAMKLSAPLSAHFLESTHERQWLDSGSGYFYDFFHKGFGVPNPKPFFSTQGFLEQFREFEGRAVLTHCLEAGERELEFMQKYDLSIASCPRSNRLLCGKYLNLERAKSLNIALGSDGKSSNANLNMLEELRTALFAYPKSEINALAEELLLMLTKNGAKALGVESGSLESSKNADIALFKLKEVVQMGADSQKTQTSTQPTQKVTTQEALQFILHAKSAHRIYINAKQAF